MSYNFTNQQAWNAFRAKYASFASITSEATADLFTEKGWGEMTRNNLPAINQFFGLLLRVTLDRIDVAKVHTVLTDSGVVETFSKPGAYLQRISVVPMRSVSPKFLNLQDGDSIDPYVVRKPNNSDERFFELMNAAYQNLVSLQDFNLKAIFVDEWGASAFTSAIFASYDVSHRIWLEESLYQCLSEMLNSVDTPLQDSQKVELTSWTDADPTDAELLELVANIQDAYTMIKTSVTQPGISAKGFDSAVDTSDMVLLVRVGILNKIRRQLITSAFNKETLNLLFENIVEVPDFGGVYYTDSNGDRLYPIYSALGERTGWTQTEGSSTEYTGTVTMVDPNEKILAVAVQKGIIFREIDMPLHTRTIPNPRGEYDNYFMNELSTIRYDGLYACMTFNKPTT